MFGFSRGEDSGCPRYSRMMFRVMNIKSIRRILWSPKRQGRVFHEQLELKLPASRLTRDDVCLLQELQRLKENLSKV